ncbi:MAG: lipopolysaccharide biosynthesis protein [Gammaproteobacteria bacterium]|nr:lipopolysaccharide biosynthesis protein [Gammaproteobacteria bacterium]
MNQIRRSATWVMTGTASQVLSQIVAIIVLARLLTPHEFGVVSVAVLITQFLLVFSEFGVGLYIVQRIDLTDNFISTSYFMAYFLGIVVAIVLYTSAPSMAVIFNIPELYAVLRVYSLMFLIQGVYVVHDALIKREMDFKYLAKADFVSYSIGYAGVSIGLAWLGFSYWSLVIGHLCQTVIRCGIIRLSSTKIQTIKPSFTEMTRIVRYGLGQTLSRLACFLSAQADGFIIASRLGVVALGIYGRANQLITMPSGQLGQIYDKILFPHISKIQNEYKRSATTYLIALTGICLLSIPLSVLVWLLGEKLVHIILGAQWVAVTEPLQVLALVMPFRLILNVSDPSARAFGKTYSRAWRQWIVACIVIVLSLILSKYGLTAVAWGIFVAAVMDAVLMMWLCIAVMKISIFELVSSIFPGVVAGLLVAIVACIVKYMPGPWQNNELMSLLIAGPLSLITVGMFVYIYRIKVW